MVSVRTGNDLQLDDVIDLYVDSTLGARRPVGDRARMAAIILLAAPAAAEYYPHIGMQAHAPRGSSPPTKASAAHDRPS